MTKPAEKNKDAMTTKPQELMPEEIWITSDGKPIWWGGGLSSPDSTKYLRADLATKKQQALVEALEKIRDEANQSYEESIEKMAEDALAAYRNGGGQR